MINTAGFRRASEAPPPEEVTPDACAGPRPNGPFTDGPLRLPAPLRALIAARGFSAGNGYLPGQIVDHTA